MQTCIRCLTAETRASSLPAPNLGAKRFLALNQVQQALPSLAAQYTSPVVYLCATWLFTAPQADYVPPTSTSPGPISSPDSSLLSTSTSPPTVPKRACVPCSWLSNSSLYHCRHDRVHSHCRHPLSSPPPTQKQPQLQPLLQWYPASPPPPLMRRPQAARESYSLAPHYYRRCLRASMVV